MALLKIENLCKSFGKRKLFDNFSLELDEGKIYALVGGNGTGKTTLFNIITGFIKSDAGDITFFNKRLNGKAPYKIARLGISRTFQDLRLINGLTVKENILLVLEKKMFHVATFKEYDRVDEILERVSLLDHASCIGGELSYGQQKLLTLGCALANNPKLYLLDEPIAGIDKDNLKKITKIIGKLKKDGKTVFQIEHNFDFLKATSDFIYKLDESSPKYL